MGRFVSSARPAAVALVVSAFAVHLPATGSVAGQADSDDASGEVPVVAESITVTATGEAARPDDLPLPVTVLDRDEIEGSQEETVADLVRRVPGVTVLRSGDRGGATTFFVRGTESDHVLALFDGVRLNSPYFAGYDWSQLPSGGVERIEVARGPYSALWGSDAVGGVVHVVPGRGADGSRAVLLGEAGDDRWRRLEGTVGWGGDRFDLFASVGDREGEGRLENSDFSNRQLLVDGGWSWSESGRLALVAQDLDAELGIPFFSPGSPSPRRRQDARQRLLALPLDTQPSSRWSLQLVPSHVERDLTLVDPDDPFGFVRGDTLADTDQVRLASHHDLGARGRHRVSWGAEWREDEVDADTNFGIDLAGEVTRVRGLFAQDVWRASDRVTVIAGLRWDDADQWGEELSPRISVGVEASRRVELRASYGEAFRQPSVGELYFPFSGNPELEPERSRSLEVGLTARLARLGRGGQRRGGQRLDAALFATDTDDLVDFDAVTFAFANAGAVEIRGAELSWRAPIGAAFDSTVSATWLDTRDREGAPLLRRPEWSGSWTLGGRFGDRLRGDLALFWVGARADLDALTFERKEVASYATADLALAYELIGGLEITARVQNLADRRYQEIDGYPAPARRLLGGIRWTR